MKTVVVNLYAGPGAGKSVAAWTIAAELKKQNILTEYVPEYAKELVWDNNMELLDGSIDNQTHLFKVQSHRLSRLSGKVSVIVTDSPLLLNLIYCKQPLDKFEKMVMSEYGKYNNFNLFIRRGSGYEKAGRIQTLVESRRIDDGIKEMMSSRGIFCGEYDRTKIELIVNNIKRSLAYNRDFAKTRPKNQSKNHKYCR